MYDNFTDKIFLLRLSLLYNPAMGKISREGTPWFQRKRRLGSKDHLDWKMTSCKVEENQGESRLFLILRLQLRRTKITPIFPEISLKIGEINIILDFPLLVKTRKVKENLDLP